MSLTAWTILYCVLAIFWFWIVRFGGAEWLEGKLVSGLLIHIWAVTWTAEGIKVFGWGALIINTVIFALGIVFPDFRLLHFF